MDAHEAISRRLSYALRHNPSQYGLTLQAGGWVPIEELLNAFATACVPLSRDELETVVATNTKARFTIDGDMIRAAQGHSVNVDLELAATRPPDVLYHGTTGDALPAIVREGLNRRRRDHVHLSTSVELARAVGARRGTPVVLAVHAGQLAKDGQLFYQADNGVWLTGAIPPRYLHQLD